jgi:guanine deaminase
MSQTFLCNYVSSSSDDQLIVKTNQFITVNDAGFVESISDQYTGQQFIDYSQHLLIPSFSDLHFHASQQRIRGVGYDASLAEWFKFMYDRVGHYDESDDYKATNQSLVEELWSYGVMCSSVLTAVNIQPTIDLMNRFERSGLTAYVGKMNCDLSEGGEPKETLEASIDATIQGIEHAKNLSDRVHYSITPEFIPTCSSELLARLGELSRQGNHPVQMHFAEGEFDSIHLRTRYPNKSYIEVYQDFGLIHEKSLVIHGISAEEKDYDIIKKENILFVHCPTAISDNPSDRNVNIKDVLNRGIRVGYGSDIGGSSTLNPLLNMVTMRRYSKIICLERNQTPITLFDAFRIMTKESGSYFGRYGVIEPGYCFSALVIEDGRHDLDLYQRFESYVYSANIAQIKARYHHGKLIEKPH